MAIHIHDVNTQKSKAWTTREIHVFTGVSGVSVAKYMYMYMQYAEAVSYRFIKVVDLHAWCDIHITYHYSFAFVHTFLLNLYMWCW